MLSEVNAHRLIVPAQLLITSSCQHTHMHHLVYDRESCRQQWSQVSRCRHQEGFRKKQALAT